MTAAGAGRRCGSDHGAAGGGQTALLQLGRSLRQYTDLPRLVARGRVARLVATLAAGTVVDVGCGSSPYRRSLVGCRYIGLDMDARVGPEAIADAHQLPLRDAVADVVLMSELLEHLACPQLALAEAARALRPGGILIVTVPFLYRVHGAPEDYWRWTPKGLERLLAHTPGLRLLSLQPKGGICLTMAAMLMDLAARPLETGARGLVRAASLVAGAALRLFLMPPVAALCLLDLLGQPWPAWAPGFVALAVKDGGNEQGQGQGHTRGAHVAGPSMPGRRGWQREG